MTIDAAAVHMGTSRRTLERQLKAGVLPAHDGLVWAAPLGVAAELAEVRVQLGELRALVERQAAGTVSDSAPGRQLGAGADSSCTAILAQLDRIKGTASDKAVERAAGMPAGFLSLARKGGRRSTRATPSWVRLGLWIKGRAAAA